MILNTDPVGRDWRVPSNWINADLSAARTSGAKHIFAIGHKPAYPFNYQTGGNDGLNQYPSNRDQFWAALESNQAEAMFAAHNHVYVHYRPNKTHMVIAGNGGSILEATTTPSQHFYGYTLVTVLNSGRVIAKSMGHDFSSATGGYLAPCPASTYPTTVRDSVDLTWQ